MASAQFSARELPELTLAIVAINGWNRILISAQMEPRHQQSWLQPEAAGASACAGLAAFEAHRPAP